MSYSVRLRSYDDDAEEWGTAYVFAVNPFLSPAISYEHDDQEPPRRSASRVTWKITAKLYGADEEAVKDAWLELRAAIESSTSPVQGAQLLHGETVIEEVSPEGGYDEFKVESLGSPESDPQWTAEMVAVIVVSAIKRIETGTTGSTIAELKQTLTYSYGEEGLVTKTLEGEVSATSGNSAETIARTLGLELPSTSFAYVTRGPEGVDVEVLDRADRKAHFTSTVRESGRVLPGGVGPGFSVDVETITVDGEEITTTTVTAEGPEAVAAVKGRRPSGKLSETQRQNDWRRTAGAVYVTRKTSPTATPLKRRAFTTSGGGRAITWTRRTGGRKPIKHLGSFAPVTIDETITLERTGSPERLLTDQIIPAPLDKVNAPEDTSGFRLEGGPDLVEKGKDASGDRWQIKIHRRYAAADFYQAFIAVAQASIAQDFSSTINREVSDRPAGRD